MDPHDLDHRFRYQAPDGDRAHLHETVRAACRGLAGVINNLCPDGREKSLAITHTEDAMMWANASIARHEGPLP